MLQSFILLIELYIPTQTNTMLTLWTEGV